VDRPTAASLVGLSEGNRSGYSKGKPLRNNRYLLDRAGTLLAIHKNLPLLFPRNRVLCCAWITNPNRACDGQTQVNFVRGYLDRAVTDQVLTPS